MSKQTAENLFAFQLMALDVEFEREHKAIPGRRFRFDFFIKPDLLIEIQGGIWMAKGAHNTGKAITRDCTKGNLATLYGFRTLSFTTDMVNSGEALDMVEKVVRSIQNA